MALDAKGKRLFVAALGNNSVEVVDLAQGKSVHSIKGLKDPQGVAYVAARNRIYVSSAGDGSVKVFEGTSYAQTKAFDFGNDADNLRYDEIHHCVYVGYGSGGIAAIDVDSETVRWKIPLPAHPEAFEAEQNGSRLFINLPDAGEIAVVDWKKQAVLSHWKLSDLGLGSNFPMSIDQAGHRLYVGFRSPPALGVFATESGKRIAQVPIHRDADDVYWDADRKLILISCGQGYLDRVRISDSLGVSDPVGVADPYRKLAVLKTAGGARTGLFDPAGNHFYLAVPAGWKSDAEIRILEMGIAAKDP